MELTLWVSLLSTAALTSTNVSELACLEQSSLPDFSAGVGTWHVGKEEVEFGFALLWVLNMMCTACAVRCINFQSPESLSSFRKVRKYLALSLCAFVLVVCKSTKRRFLKRNRCSHQPCRRCFSVAVWRWQIPTRLYLNCLGRMINADTLGTNQFRLHYRLLPEAFILTQPRYTSPAPQTCSCGDALSGQRPNKRHLDGPWTFFRHSSWRGPGRAAGTRGAGWQRAVPCPASPAARAPSDCAGVALPGLEGFDLLQRMCFSTPPNLSLLSGCQTVLHLNIVRK